MSRFWSVWLLTASIAILALVRSTGRLADVLVELAVQVSVWFLVLGTIAFIIWVSTGKKTGRFLSALSILFFIGSLAELGAWALRRHVESTILSKGNGPHQQGPLGGGTPVVCVDEIPACVTFPASSDGPNKVREERKDTFHAGFYIQRVGTRYYTFYYATCPAYQECDAREARNASVVRDSTESLDVFEEVGHQGGRAYLVCKSQQAGQGFPANCYFIRMHNGYVLKLGVHGAEPRDAEGFAFINSLSLF
ncbi:MAG: hypothetical protein L0338_09470 [Acidobacteria bacterium]|nr:hypothetical protein [Acidobacteriota bacterium]